MNERPAPSLAAGEGRDGSDHAPGAEQPQSRSTADLAARPPRPRLVFPLHAPGLRIGLFGGSFNPPHDAHRMVSLFALKRLGLDRVWWLVTPGNPLKVTQGLPTLSSRLAAARAVARHPRIDVTDLEAALGTRFSIDLLRELRRRRPGVRFVWLMGADNLSSFHRWRSWRDIAALAPFAVLDRAGATLSATSAPAAVGLRRYRLPETKARALPGMQPPAWVYLFGVKSPVSSTSLRAQKKEHGRG